MAEWVAESGTMSFGRDSQEVLQLYLLLGACVRDTVYSASGCFLLGRRRTLVEIAFSEGLLGTSCWMGWDARKLPCAHIIAWAYVHSNSRFLSVSLSLMCGNRFSLVR